MTEHTSRHYEQELRGLKEKILLLGGRVEEMIASAMTSLTARDPDLARKVIESDTLVDAAEMEVDHLCLNLLALRQPAASDLRFITTALKIVTDLERIGDLAVNTAERSIELAQEPPLAVHRYPAHSAAVPPWWARRSTRCRDGSRQARKVWRRTTPSTN
jgi:phosphate transport system protein